MLYRPNFCCNCGEKIERVEWNLLTSRRFCAVCAGEQKKHDILPRAVIGGGVLALVFGMGTLMAGRVTETVPLRTLKDSVPVSKADSTEKKEAADRQLTKSSQPASNTALELTEQRATERNTSTGTVHFCGAKTKKGTPCSRRVKNAGIRCWQHEGKTGVEEGN